MAKFIPNSTYNLALAKTQSADIETVCSAFPDTYYQGIHPDMWIAETLYVVGDEVRSPTDNDMVYECTVEGTTGVGEPAWSVVQDETFTDGTTTWKAHTNTSLATCPLESGDKVQSDVLVAEAVVGRKLTFAEKQGIISHRAGTITHTAFLNSTNKTVELVTTATTTAPADDEIIAGRTTIFHEVSVSLSIV